MRRLVVAALAVAVLGAGTWIVLKRSQKEARQRRSEAVLIRFDETRVQALDIETPETLYRFERQPDGWFLVAPFRDEADPSAVARVFQELQALPVVRTLTSHDALSDYGLDPPRFRFRLQGADAPPIELGDPVPTGNGLFARVEGRPGVLVVGVPAPAATLLWSFRVHHLRNRRVLSLDPKSLDSLRGAQGPRSLSLERREDGWWVTEPLAVPAEEALVRTALAVFEEGRVREFLDGRPVSDPALELDPPRQIWWFGAGETTQRLDIGAPASEETWYARRHDRQTLLAVSLPGLEHLTLDLDRFASRRLARLNRYQVVGFAFRHGTSELAAERTEEGWRTLEGRVLDEEQVLGFLAALFNMPVKAWEPLGGPTAVEEGAVVVTLEGGSRRRIGFLPGGWAAPDFVPGMKARLAGPLPALPGSSG